MTKWIVLFVIGAGSLAHADAKPQAADVRFDDSPDTNAVDAKDITVTASTTLCEKKPKLCHGPEQLLDADLGTAWCEGLPGDGVGATITFTFAHPVKLDGFVIVPHFAKTFALAEANARIASLDIATDDGTFTADLDDIVAKVKKENGVHEVSDPCGCGDEGCLSRDERIQAEMTSDYVSFPSDVKTQKVVLTLKRVYKGTKYKDTCASLIRFIQAK
jgi:hypothetical protein